MPNSDEEFDQAVQDLWQRLDPPGGMATRWFLVIEGVGSEGGRCMDYVWPADTKTWDVKGLLHEALDQQLAGMVRDEIAED